MKRGGDATRRNRNIGTAKQGLGQDNRLVIPWCGLKLYYENLTDYKVVLRSVHSKSLPFIVERTRTDSCHACTIDDIASVLQHTSFSDFVGIDFIVMRQPKRKEEIINPIWGRLAYFAEIGAYQGRATTKHGHRINVRLESIRATQLYRTLFHEIGHSIDNDRDPIAFDRKSPLEKETFAHQYADQLRERLIRFGIIPFARIFDRKTISRDGLSVSDFTAINEED